MSEFKELTALLFRLRAKCQHHCFILDRFVENWWNAMNKSTISYVEFLKLIRDKLVSDQTNFLPLCVCNEYLNRETSKTLISKNSIGKFALCWKGNGHSDREISGLYSSE